MNQAPLPVVALTLGDPAGIGPELIARLLAETDATTRANVVLVGDPWLWAWGQQVAGVTMATDTLATLADVRGRTGTLAAVASCGSGPAMTCRASATSRAVRPSGPGQSSEDPNAIRP